ncbi:MAG: hypothetical protein IT292_03535 [Deltaproteobacteria bacterium]|nr:hypothetical protein [Deltaproteobacteria bacterium]
MKENVIIRCFIVLLFCLILPWGFAGCSARQPIVAWETGFKVTVFGEGVVSEEEKENLIHQVKVTSTDLATITSSDSTLKMLKIKVSVFHDVNGGVIGLLLDFKDDSEVRNNFQWQHGDMVLAVNAEVVAGEESLVKFFSVLKERRKATLSIQREGKAHLFYYEVS